MVTTLDPPLLLGAQVPRIDVAPDGYDHPQWDEVVGLLAELGYELDPWQLETLRRSLMRQRFQGVERWAAFTVGVCAPRQNGKNGLLEPRQLAGAIILREPMQMHSAHLADTSKEAFRRLDQLIDANEWLSRQVRHVWRTNGHESIEFTNGCRIRFRTRTKGGGRGFGASPVYFDEAMALPEISVKAILPVLTAQPDPQVWYTGSAVDQTEQPDGIAFARVRDRALSGDADRLMYREWSLPYESPGDVPVEVLDDPVSWASTNAAFGRRITEDYVRAERGELDDRGFAVERCGVGDWPDVSGDSTSLVPLEVWDSLGDDPAAPAAKLLGFPLVFAVDVSPDRSMSSIVVAGRREDGNDQLELVDRRPGTAWVVERVVGLNSRHNPIAVMADGIGPAGALIHEIEASGVAVTALSAGDYSKACGHLLDSIDGRTVRHLRSPELRAAVKGAVRRPLGDSWALSRRTSAVDITTLVAGTVALWGLSTLGHSGEVQVF